MTASIKRRTFLQRSAALAGAAAGSQLFAAPAVLADPSPNEKLGVAVVGCSGAGGGNPGKAASERLVALVDIDDKRIAQAADRIKDKVPNPRVYYDYRKMIDECHKDIDVVLIATPDHHHAPAAIRAINLGKAAFVLTGHLAMNAGVGKKLEWDVEKMHCTNVPEINQYVRRSYRKGWEV